MVNPKLNPMRKESLYLQRNHFKIKTKLRLIEHNLATRKNKGQMYVCGYTKKTSNANKKLRVKYGNENENKPVLESWDLVYFTDEAHCNPEEGFQ
jgi:hypothetical protein